MHLPATGGMLKNFKVNKLRDSRWERDYVSGASAVHAYLGENRRRGIESEPSALIPHSASESLCTEEGLVNTYLRDVQGFAGGNRFRFAGINSMFHGWIFEYFFHYSIEQRLSSMENISLAIKSSSVFMTNFRSHRYAIKKNWFSLREKIIGILKKILARVHMQWLQLPPQFDILHWNAKFPYCKIYDVSRINLTLMTDQRICKLVRYLK